ncbi:MAG: hypothetical protein ACTHKC_09195 [Candidatus Nitrosocosmicus sp.]
MSSDKDDVYMGIVEITPENKDVLVKLALEMARRDCGICKKFEIPYIRCLKCARDVCEKCTGYIEPKKCQCKECYNSDKS